MILLSIRCPIVGEGPLCPSTSGTASATIFLLQSPLRKVSAFADVQLVMILTHLSLPAWWDLLLRVMSQLVERHQSHKLATESSFIHWITLCSCEQVHFSVWTSFSYWLKQGKLYLPYQPCGPSFRVPRPNITHFMKLFCFQSAWNSTWRVSKCWNEQVIISELPKSNGKIERFLWYNWSLREFWFSRRFTSYDWRRNASHN